MNGNSYMAQALAEAQAAAQQAALDAVDKRKRVSE